jgi:spermidine/putrescine transport system ATP-binding protein
MSPQPAVASYPDRLHDDFDRRGESAVELRGVSKRFGDFTAVDSISLSVAKGEFLTLLGPSGCGKTTTLRIIGGFELPNEGSLRICGQEMGARPPHKRPVNTVFQNYALFPHLSVAQNVAYGLQMSGVPNEERNRRVGEALEMVRLPGVEQRRPAELSGGQQQRVALARALVNKPKVLLLDEPLGALDLKLRKAMQLELKALNREVGATFIYVTHDQEEALTMSDRIAVMSEGRILQVDSPAAMYESPRTRFVADFIGQTNFLDGRLLDRDGGFGTVELPGAASIRVRFPDDAQTNGDVTVAIRPEKIAFLTDLPNGMAPAGWNQLTGVVSEGAYLGAHTQISVRIGDRLTIAVHRQNVSGSANGIALGTTVTIAFAPESATVLLA